MDMNMKNKVVFVTGANGGSGRAIAEAFLNEDATVIATDLKKPEWKWDKNCGRPLFMELDVSKEDQVTSIMEQVIKQLGGIDILVNNAGISLESPIHKATLSVWEKMFAVNTIGTFLCTRAVVSSLIERKVPGRIINISSVAGKNGFPNSSGYCASKAAVIGMTRSLAAELGEHGITVNAICPGSVDTPMIEGVIDNISANTGMTRPDVRTMMESGIPLKRFQTPEDVANLVLFLASDIAENISGESINLDGGAVRD